MSNLTVPGTNVQLADGDVVILSSYPDTKWILHNGWYTYAGQQQMGWYFVSIPYNEILPMSKDDLQYITVVSGGAGLPAPGHDCCHPHTPGPQMNPQMKWELDRSMVCVATIAERDLLARRLLPHGKLVRVADTGDGPKYFAWNQIHSRWDEEKFTPDIVLDDKLNVDSSNGIENQAVAQAIQTVSINDDQAAELLKELQLSVEDGAQ